MIHLKVNSQRKQINTQTQGLLHYYAFLHDKGMSWDDMLIAPRNRPTYQFRKHHKDACMSGNIARSTLQKYKGVIAVNFYKFYLAIGRLYDNPPLFIAQNGSCYQGRTFDARWGEIRNAVRNQHHQFNHEFHNLHGNFKEAIKRIIYETVIVKNETISKHTYSHNWITGAITCQKTIKLRYLSWA